SAVRRALELRDNQKSDEAQAVDKLRNTLLPSTSVARQAILQREADTPEHQQQLTNLIEILQTHPGLERNRATLHSFGMMLNRVSSLSERTPTSPLLTAIMAGLNLPVSGSNSVGATNNSVSGVSNTNSLGLASSRLADALNIESTNKGLARAAEETMAATGSLLKNITGGPRSANSVLSESSSRLSSVLGVDRDKNSDLVGAATKVLKATQDMLGNITSGEQSSNSALTAAASRLTAAIDVNRNENGDLLRAAERTMKATENMLGNISARDQSSHSTLSTATSRLNNAINVESTTTSSNLLDAARIVTRSTGSLLAQSGLINDKK
ncbi:TPA: hypothetical protein ACPFI9_004164, partial [Providencia rettgeri]